MKDYFYDIAASLVHLARVDELITAYYEGEDSDFCRLNGSRIRQAGHVSQHSLQLRLICRQKQLVSTITLAGSLTHDQKQCEDMLEVMRQSLAFLPDDPYLLTATALNSTEHDPPSQLPAPQECVETILRDAEGLDLVGIYAGGGVFRGFANSLGQRNWFASHSFHLDFSLYLHRDKAVKSSYAGFIWEQSEWRRTLSAAKVQLAVLGYPPKTIEPGQYRVFLAPQAVDEVLDLLSWNAFSIKAQHRKQSPLLRLMAQSESLSPQIFLSEDINGGLSPNFDEHGFIRPRNIPLIDSGRLHGSLISARSAQEFGLSGNGASSREAPESLTMAGGQLQANDVLKALGTGILVNNLWYLAYSDRNACRMTGMTRFATFWVENGAISAPLNVMRFDESLYRMFGSHLEGLTSEVAFLPSASTYERRSTVSRRAPGALIDQFHFSL